MASIMCESSIFLVKINKGQVFLDRLASEMDSFAPFAFCNARGIAIFGYYNYLWLYISALL